MKYVIALSGGMDSATLAYYLKSKGHELKAISFDYGQRHKRELECAKKIAEHLKIKHRIIDISFLSSLLPGSSLTDKGVDVPEGHYEAESMKDTVVPNRNMIFVSILAAHALALKYDGVALGIHAGDHAIYPDCRPGWVEKIKEVVQAGNWNAEKFEIITPFIGITKIEIIEDGLGLNVPYEDTRTCYTEHIKACGKCGSCQERLEAFAANNIKDPISYV